MKTEKISANMVEYHELEAHIRKVYNLDDPKEMFSIVVMEEWTNDSQYLFHLEKQALDRWQAKDLAKWKANPLGFHQFKLYAILQYMVNNGHLEEGNLLITVCW